MERALLDFFGAGVGVIAANRNAGIAGKAEMIEAGGDLVRHLASGRHHERILELLERVVRDVLGDTHRGNLSRNAIRTHLQRMPALLVRFRPQPTLLAIAFATANGIGALATGGMANPARKVAADIINRANRARALQDAGLDTGLSTFLIERLFNGLLGQRALFDELTGELERYFGVAAFETATKVQDSQPPADAASDQVKAKAPPAIPPTRYSELSALTGVSVAALRGIVEAVRAGCADGAGLDEQLIERGRYCATLKERLLLRQHPDAQVRQLLSDASVWLEAGQFDDADDLLARAERIDLEVAEAEPADQGRRVLAGETRMDRSRLADLRGQTDRAAHLKDSASDLIAAGAPPGATVAQATAPREPAAAPEIAPAIAAAPAAPAEPAATVTAAG